MSLYFMSMVICVFYEHFNQVPSCLESQVSPEGSGQQIRPLSCLFLEEATVRVGHEILMGISNNSSMIVGN